MKEYTCSAHYNALVDENHDPVHDPLPLRNYMDKWDGQQFLELLAIKREQSVLEIGVGTGRLAQKIAPLCQSLTGIDLSPKTVQRGRENLFAYANVTLICDDFITHNFQETFDLIYSSLTFLHIKDKKTAIQKVYQLLNNDGRFVLSIDKNQNKHIEFGDRFIRVYPDTPEATQSMLEKSGFEIEKQCETEFAHLFSAKKHGNL